MCENHSSPKAKNTDKNHDKEHLNWSRRSFLKNLGMAGGASFLLGKIPLVAHAMSPLSFGVNDSNSERILVMVRLKGGNDGLNTVIPIYDYGRYQNLRPGIAIPANQALQLTQELGLHPALNPLFSLWNDDSMKLLNNVGYPDQNLSHFRSSDIWSSASDAQVEWEDGWLGRFFQDQYPDFLLNPPAIPPAIQIGGVGDLVFQGENYTNFSINVSTPEQLEYIASVGELYDTSNVPDCVHGDQIKYLRTITNNTFTYADVVSQAYQSGTNAVEYSGQLGNQFSIIAKLIKGNLGTKLYMVTLNGFDTHANQPGQHQNLLNTLAQNIQSFYQDLQHGDWDKKVLSFTFSEFGRRPQQNASQGTDHGAAAPMFLFGPELNGSSSMGNLPDLNDLDANNNLKYSIDFRSVYATLLEDWLCIDPSMVDMVMGTYHERLNLGFNCISTAVQGAHKPSNVLHNVRYDNQGAAWLYLTLPEAGHVQIDLYNAVGQSLGTLWKGFMMREDQSVLISRDQVRIPGYYVYRVQYNNRVYSGKALIK